MPGRSGAAAQKGEGMPLAGERVQGGPGERASRGGGGVCGFGMQGPASDRRRPAGLDEGREVAVDPAYTADPADDLLPDVAAFVVVDGRQVEAGFRRQQVRGEFVTPRRNSMKILMSPQFQ